MGRISRTHRLARYLCIGPRRIDVPMLSFACKRITYVCGFKDSKKWGGVSIVQMGQSSNSMGLNWTGIPPMYPQPPLQVRVSLRVIMANTLCT